MFDTSRELVDVIDDSNLIVATVERRQAYAEGLSLRIVHVMVECGGKLYVVRHALSVRYLPGYFCTSAGGHVIAGETFETGAARELEEEIGLRAELEHVDTFSYQASPRFLIGLFIVRIGNESNVVLNPNEVLDGAFYSESEIAKLDSSLFHPHLQICIDKSFAHLRAVESFGDHA